MSSLLGKPMEDIEKTQRSVFVGNIPYEATEQQLKEVFSQVGPVVNFRIVYDRETGKPKGYGFCEYQDLETAKSAMRNLNDHDFHGRNLRVGHAAGETSNAEKALAQAVTGPLEEPLYGTAVEPTKAPEAISRAVASLPPEQMFELMKQMKMCIQNNPNEARNMLLQNPQLAYALLQAQIVMKIVDPQVALAMLHRQSEQIPPLMPSAGDQVTNSEAVTSQAAPQSAQPAVTAVSQMPPQSAMQDIDHRRAPPGAGLGPPGLPAERPQSSSIGLPPQSAPSQVSMANTNMPPPSMGNFGPGPGVRGPGSGGGLLGDRPPGPPAPGGFDRNIPGPGGPFMDRGNPGGPGFRGPGPVGGGMGRGGPGPQGGGFGGPPQGGPGGPPQGGPGGPPMGRPDPRDPRSGRVGPGPGPGMGAPPRQQGLNPSLLGAARAAGPGPGGAATAAGNITSQDQEKAQLIMQVLQLSDEQIALLPPDQRQSILILKEQIARSTNP